MSEKGIKLFVCISAVLLFSIQAELSVRAAAPHTEEKTYVTGDPGKYGAEEEFAEIVEAGGKRYRLEHVERTVKEKRLRVFVPVDDKIVITSPFFMDDSAEHRPEQALEQAGKIYKLKNFRMVEAKGAESAVEVSRIVIYHDVEQADTIPPTAAIMNEGSDITQKKTVNLPLKSYTFSGYRWVDNFEFPITVREYDAGSYLLGDMLVPGDKEMPLYGYENQLLRLIGVNPEYYRINTIEWTADSYGGEGILCRDAVAKGSKMIADCKAVYSGITSGKRTKGNVIEAEYYYDRDNGQDQGEWEYVMTATGFYKQQRDHIWEKISWICTVSMGLAVLLFFMLLLFLKARRRKHKAEEKLV